MPLTRPTTLMHTHNSPDYGMLFDLVAGSSEPNALVTEDELVRGWAANIAFFLSATTPRHSTSSSSSSRKARVPRHFRASLSPPPSTRSQASSTRNKVGASTLTACAHRHSCCRGLTPTRHNEAVRLDEVPLSPDTYKHTFTEQQCSDYSFTRTRGGDPFHRKEKLWHRKVMEPDSGGARPYNHTESFDTHTHTSSHRALLSAVQGLSMETTFQKDYLRESLKPFISAKVHSLS